MGAWFQLTINPVELIVRGTVMYIGLVLTIRFLLRRDIGSMSVADILFIVLIADAAQNAMAGEYKSITDGIVLVGTLVAWNVLLDWLSFRSKAIHRLLEPPSIALIKNGRWLRQNLKREWITVDEVLAKLRQMEIEDIGQVREAYLESDGELGVIRNDRVANARPKSRRLGSA